MFNELFSCGTHSFAIFTPEGAFKMPAFDVPIGRSLVETSVRAKRTSIDGPAQFIGGTLYQIRDADKICN